MPARSISRPPARSPPVAGYYDGGGPLDGQAFGFGQSGILPDPDGICSGRNQAYVLADAAGANRYPPRDGSGHRPRPRSRRSCARRLGVALQARAQIRQPLGSFVEVTISVVDIDGTILGIVRTPDAPVFGTDVSLQKARSTLFFSSAAAFSILPTLPTNTQERAARRLLPQACSEFLRQPLGGWCAFADALDRQSCPTVLSGRREWPAQRPAQPPVRTVEPLQHRPAARSGVRRARRSMSSS